MVFFPLSFNSSSDLQREQEREIKKKNELQKRFDLLEEDFVVQKAQVRERKSVCGWTKVCACVCNWFLWLAWDSFISLIVESQVKIFFLFFTHLHISPPPLNHNESLQLSIVASCLHPFSSTNIFPFFTYILSLHVLSSLLTTRACRRSMRNWRRTTAPSTRS